MTTASPPWPPADGTLREPPERDSANRDDRDRAGGVPAFGDPDRFVQPAPAVPNRWRADPALRQAVRRVTGAAAFGVVEAELDEFADRCGREFAPLADAAERHPPRHVPYDAWGERIDRIEVHRAWTQLVGAAKAAGLVSLAYDRPYGDGSRVVQGALAQLFGPVSATALCPIAMTDAAVTVLRRYDPELADRYAGLLAGRAGWTAGQWMTEKEGGSDVGGSATVARPIGDGSFGLWGTKWFTSAITADVALALARPEGAVAGSAGLGLFLVELRRPDGTWNHLRVRRLKDKLGTRGLPTAELDLLGTVGWPVGGTDRGVPKVAGMLNVTRLWSAHGAVGTVGQALALARDYAGRRQVAGGPLASRPAHQAWLAELAAAYEAMLALSLRAAQLVGGAEGAGDGQLARVVVPLAKLACAREAVRVTSELLEAFGGAGYLEDTGLPRLLRDVQVQSIWEGTTTVLALDVRRALADPAVGAALAEDARRQLAERPVAGTADVADRVGAALGALEARMVARSEADARALAWGLARCYQASLLCAAAGWASGELGDDRAVAAARVFATGRLVDPEPEPAEALGSLALGACPAGSGTLDADRSWAAC